jgi:hypothetical protein
MHDLTLEMGEGTYGALKMSSHFWKILKPCTLEPASEVGQDERATSVDRTNLGIFGLVLTVEFLLFLLF